MTGHRVTSGGRDECEGDAGVAAGGFHNRLSRAEQPLLSASQIIEAPILHFTLKAGLRPSIFANTLPVMALNPHEGRFADGERVVVEGIHGRMAPEAKGALIIAKADGQNPGGPIHLP